MWLSSTNQQQTAEISNSIGLANFFSTCKGDHRLGWLCDSLAVIWDVISILDHQVVLKHPNLTRYAMREWTRPILTNGSDVTNGGLSLLARLSFPFSEIVKEGVRVLIRSLLHERSSCDVALGNHLKGRFCRQPVLASSGPTITSPLGTALLSYPTGRADFCIWQDDYRKKQPVKLHFHFPFACLPCLLVILMLCSLLFATKVAVR